MGCFPWPPSLLAHVLHTLQFQISILQLRALLPLRFVMTFIYVILLIYISSLVAQTVKRPPTMQEIRVQSLGQDLLEKAMATHSSILAWKIPWMEEPGRLQSMGSQRVGHD